MDIEEKHSHGAKKNSDWKKLTQEQLIALATEQETRINELIASTKEKEERTRFLAVQLERLQHMLSVKVKGGNKGEDLYELKRPIEELSLAVKNLAQVSGMPGKSRRSAYKNARARSAKARAQRMSHSINSSSGYGIR